MCSQKLYLRCFSNYHTHMVKTDTTKKFLFPLVKPKTGLGKRQMLLTSQGHRCFTLLREK